MICSTIGARVRGWDEDKEIDKLFVFFAVITVLLTAVTSAGIYLLATAMFPLVLDPFDLVSSSSALAAVYSVWWFFGLIISAVALAIAAVVFLTVIYSE